MGQCKHTGLARSGMPASIRCGRVKVFARLILFVCKERCLVQQQVGRTGQLIGLESDRAVSGVATDQQTSTWPGRSAEFFARELDAILIEVLSRRQTTHLFRGQVECMGALAVEAPARIATQLIAATSSRTWLIDILRRTDRPPLEFSSR